MTGIPGFCKRLPWSIAALLVCQTGVTAAPLWDWVDPLPQGHDLYSIVAGENVVVAVGGSGTILVSPDGIEWEVRAATTEYALLDVAYGGGNFVAVGGKVGEEMSPGLGVFLNSEDGWHWEERHRTSYFTPGAVNWNGAQFIAVGRAGRVLISPDGDTWSEHGLPVDEWDMVDVTWDGSRYVALGYANYFTGGLSYFTSVDGSSWEIQALGAECVPSALTWVEGRFVAVGGLWPGQACVLTSDNGEDWQSASWDVGGSFLDVSEIHGQLLAVGNFGLVATSLDGRDWVFNEAPTNGDLFGLTWAGENFIVIGEGGILLSSPDGSSWQNHSSRMLGLSHNSEVQEVVKGNEAFVAVGDSGIITSLDGVIWTQQQTSPTFFGLEAVVWTREGFWAVGNNAVLWSPDGSTWDLVWSGDNVRLFDVSWSGSLLVAVGWNPSSSSRQTVVVTSSNGLDWSYHWLESEGALAAVEWTGSRFVAVGYRGLQYESFDGINWVRQPLDELIVLRELAWNGDRLVAIGHISGIGPLVMTSSGDLEWEVVTPPEGVEIDFDDILWTGERFVAVGLGNGDEVAYSLDGLEWASESSDTGLLLIAVGGDEHTIFSFGRGDRIIKRKIPFGSAPSPRRPTARVSPISSKELSRQPVP